MNIRKYTLNLMKKLGLSNPNELRFVEDWITSNYDIPEEEISVYYDLAGVGQNFQVSFESGLDIESFVEVLESMDEFEVSESGDDYVEVLKRDSVDGVGDHKSKFARLTNDGLRLELSMGIETKTDSVCRNRLELAEMYFESV